MASGSDELVASKSTGRNKQHSLNHILNPVAEVPAEPSPSITPAQPLSPIQSLESVVPVYNPADTYSSHVPANSPDCLDSSSFGGQQMASQSFLPGVPGSSRSVYSCVAHHHNRLMIGYGVYFGPNNPRNESGCSSADKSVYRSELRAIARALHKILIWTLEEQTSGDTTVPKMWNIYTCREYCVKRVAGPANPDVDEVSHTRGAPCMDIVLYIRGVLAWLKHNDRQINITLTSQTDANTRMAHALAQEGAEGKGLVEVKFPKLLMKDHPRFYTKVPDDQYHQVYTDGSTFMCNGETRAGYGMFFGVYDARNESGPIVGKGTGPRASLGAMLRALLVISEQNQGTKNWEIVSCRGQYVRSIFELSREWQRHGWKRNAGKPIANLDIYREARRVLDDLTSRGFSIRGRFIPQKDRVLGLMIADLQARHGAGNTSIELPIRMAGPFEIPRAPEDLIVHHVQTSVKFEKGKRGDKERPRWTTTYGVDDNRNANGWLSGAQKSQFAGSMYAIMRVLRVIDTEAERRWVVYTDNKDALEFIESYERGKRKRSGHDTAESVMALVQHLEKHGYSITFAYREDDAAREAWRDSPVDDSDKATHESKSPTEHSTSPFDPPQTGGDHTGLIPDSGTLYQDKVDVEQAPGTSLSPQLGIKAEDQAHQD